MAERLSLPVVSRAIAYHLDGMTLTVTRQLEQGLDVVAVDLPAVLALSGEVTTPRYPSFKQVIAGKKKPVEVVSPTADLGIPADVLGAAGARTTVLTQVPAPRRHGGVIVEDDGHAHERLLAFLISRGLV